MIKYFLIIILFSSQGFTMDKLTECPNKPNCVSSQSQAEYAQIAPLKMNDDFETTKKRILAVMNSMPRTKLIKDDNSYLHFTAKTRILRFTDDIEFLIDEANKVVHFKSASRKGYKDFGVNRERLESIRSNW